jgi:hypothetical protein
VRQVSREDAADCMRLVLIELWGEERAWKAEIQVEGQTVRLSQLYAELQRLTGRAGLWDVVQKLWLAARRREGIQPLTGVPLPTLSTQSISDGIDGTTEQNPWIGSSKGRVCSATSPEQTEQIPKSDGTAPKMSQND